jgi:hypothetical protein
LGNLKKKTKIKQPVNSVLFGTEWLVYLILLKKKKEEEEK